ncbi:hypothetical protein UA08_03906 [Talaromyces atroroseus]|uniref:DUF3074 domain-containing protein n=1 Tax=Talaromyces atroroseus TaxID=1441469 RepID=A0A225AJE2_TALAT|nr:hypothetical protein UA08_03906 [Talaromyces atroroseus]OKL60980.1 hypothetical protein UA08_03906 [Talaromyces atroroseus]
MSTSYLRLNPLPFSSLPPHPSLNNNRQERGQEDSLGLKQFLTSIFSEATALISSTTNPQTQTFKPDRKPRSSAPSTAKVQLLTSSSSSSGSSNDYWVCRKSIHADKAQKGSASWAEFEHGLRENHSENEMDYTPSVASVEHLVQWPVIDSLEEWKGVDMHAALISPRTFISLVISAYEPAATADAAASPDNNSNETPLQGFYTIQIPLLFKKESRDNLLPESLRSKITSAVPKNTIFAHYASVERVRLLPAASTTTGESSGSGQRIEWIMATTSDAGGLIPQWVQRSWTMGGVPKAVVADVGLFLGWVERKRSDS